jgi:two-component system, NtrC family, sensor kinase
MPPPRSSAPDDPGSGARDQAPGRAGLSLRAALALRTLLPLFVILGTASALILYTMEREVENRMKEDVELVARGLRLPVVHALEREREGTLSQALRSALEIRRLYSAHIYGPQGQHLLSLGPGLGDEPPHRVADMVQVGEEVGEYGLAGGLRVYSYFVPLADQWGQSLGVLHLTRRRADIDASIHRLRLQVGGLFLLGMGLMGVLVLRGHHRAVVRPVDRLGESMARVRGGDRNHRATVEGPTELAGLARSFNSMLAAMQNAEAELTARRREQARLERELAEAEKLAAVGELAGGVAHELGSPLSVIDGKAQRMLRQEGLPAGIRTQLDTVRGEVRRMEGIIRQLLEFGRQDTGRRRRVQVEQVLRGAVEASSELARRRGVAVTLEVDGGVPMVEADPRRLEEAVTNLLVNACHAAGEGEEEGRVRIRCTPDGEWVRVEVDDDGPGIPTELASRIFEPFFTTKATGEGTGLGLAVVHGVVEGMGGSVSVERSTLGGARFLVRLPTADTEAGVASTDARETSHVG